MRSMKLSKNKVDALYTQLATGPLHVIQGLSQDLGVSEQRFHRILGVQSVAQSSHY